MKNPIRRASLALALFVGLAPGGALYAQDFIWDQPPLTSGTNVIDQEITGGGAPFSTYLVSDIVVDDPIILDSVTVYFTNNTGMFGVTSGRLNIFSSSVPSALDNPADGQKVSVSVGVLGFNLLAITASGLNIPLSPGRHWIGLSPIEGINQEFHFRAISAREDVTMGRNPSGLFGLGIDWFPGTDLDSNFVDAAILVTGTFVSGNTFEPPAAAETFRGVALVGGLAEMQESDDLRALFNPGFTLNSTEAPVWLIFDANVGNTTDFNFLVESQAGTPGLTYTCEAWNYNTNMFDVIGIEPESFSTDTVETYPLVASDHFDGSGNVRSRVGWRQTGFTLNFPWEVRVDVVGWDPTQ